MRSWVLALPIGVEFWAWDPSREDYVPRTVQLHEAQALVNETRRALAHWRAVALPGSTPYTPPVIEEHERAGKRLGSLLDAKLAPSPAGSLGLYLLVDWTSEAAANIRALKSRHVSIGTLPTYRDGDGAVFAPVIDELSLTEHPRLKTIGSIQDTLALRLADAPHPPRETTMTIEEMMKLIEELRAEVDALKAWHAEASAEEAAPAAELADGEMTEEEAKAEDELIVKLSDKIAKKVGADLMTKLSGMRLGNAPAAPAPAKAPTLTKLAKAKAAGKSGRAAILDSLS